MELATVYIQFHKMLLGFIKSKVNNNEDAEDILHNIFIKITSGMNGLERNEKLQSWIYTVARNSIIDYYRSTKNKKSSSSIEKLEDSFTEEEYNDTTKGLDCCLMDFVRQLPEEYRDVIVDVELKGLKQKDISVSYNLAYPTIRSRVQRGREKLKQILLECCHVEWDNRGNVLDVVSRSGCDKEKGDTCNN
jgi:RNA polymerase sigma-70 factor, ECF subfamily